MKGVLAVEKSIKIRYKIMGCGSSSGCDASQNSTVYLLPSHVINDVLFLSNLRSLKCSMTKCSGLMEVSGEPGRISPPRKFELYPSELLAACLESRLPVFHLSRGKT